MRLSCVLILVTAPTAVCVAQGAAAGDTSVALTPEMQVLDSALIASARYTLERWGTTFHAYAYYVPDTSKGSQAMELGLEHSIESRLPSVFRDSLRSTLRIHQSRSPEARVTGIITDSIAGPIEEAVDGADSPAVARMAITELEDRNGRCRLVERDYHFVKEPAGDYGWGTIVFGPPRIRRCQPTGYWPTYSPTDAPTLPSRPRLAAPIVRPLDISSLGVIFTVVGNMHGKLTIFDDSVVVAFDSLVATRQLPNDRRRVRLDSIRVGVGVGDEKSWSPVDDSKALKIGRLLAPGGKIVRRNVKLVLPHPRREEDAESWIVVTFHLTVGRRGQADYQPNATTYAHSKRGVLAEASSLSR